MSNPHEGSIVSDSDANLQIGNIDVSADNPVPITSETQDNQTDILNQLLSAMTAVASTKGIAADLRVTLLSGTVTTVTGITNFGSQPATTFLPNVQNQTAILSNINNISV